LSESASPGKPPGPARLYASAAGDRGVVRGLGRGQLFVRRCGGPGLPPGRFTVSFTLVSEYRCVGTDAAAGLHGGSHIDLCRSLRSGSPGIGWDEYLSVRTSSRSNGPGAVRSLPKDHLRCDWRRRGDRQRVAQAGCGQVASCEWLSTLSIRGAGERRAGTARGCGGQVKKMHPVAPGRRARQEAMEVLSGGTSSPRRSDHDDRRFREMGRVEVASAAAILGFD
jgi:hypothetical protein